MCFCFLLRGAWCVVKRGSVCWLKLGHITILLAEVRHDMIRD